MQHMRMCTDIFHGRSRAHAGCVKRGGGRERERESAPCARAHGEGAAPPAGMPIAWSKPTVSLSFLRGEKEINSGGG